MLGILVYLYFLFIGYAYSCYVFKEKDIYFRGWMGGIFGNVLLMAGIVIPSFICGFTYLSHIILIVLAALPLAYFIKKSGVEEFRTLFCSVSGKSAEGLPELPGKKRGKAVAAPSAERMCMDWKILVFLVLPIAIVIWILLTNHILAPDGTGAVTTGQSTYGDLRLHLSFITSIAEQKTFPPDYSIMPGNVIGYPFFVDMLSSSLFLFGTPLRWAVLVPSYIISLLLVGGFYIVAYSLTKRRAAAALATVLFFINGGLGFAYFFEGAKSDSSVFTQIFTSYYHTPTNARSSDFYKNIHWANTICDMIIPQRTTMAGWCMLQPTIWLLTEAVKTGKRKLYIILGIISGCMLMIHTHMLLAFAMICAVMFFLYLIEQKGAEAKKAFVLNWVIFGGIAVVLIAPQFFVWTLRQTSGGSFLSFHFNWENNNGSMTDPYLWFYLKNWGITALFAVPAVLTAPKDNKKLIAGAALVFVVAELVLFQPLTYDNNKMFFVPYMILVILVAAWLVKMWDALKNVKGRAYLATIVIAAGTLSGALTICREYVSGTNSNYGKYQMFSADEMEMAEYIRENTPSDSVILTSDSFASPVYALTGRDIFAGPANFVGTHGLSDGYEQKLSELDNAYSGTYEELLEFCEENGIDYVYVGREELSSSDFSVNTDTIDRLELVYSVGSESLYNILY
ncbi:MAG: hypothetical protein LIO59_00755 [Oscillospiraceae bacterium]|nr:hypothetical protein [Oscillospiraceae bacterium]